MSRTPSIPGLAFALCLAGTGLAGAQGLSGGATALNETHGDWTVACTAPDGLARCAVSQSQVSGETGQRVLTIELMSTQSGDAATGMLVLPFGLSLEDGVRLAIDETGALPPLRFSTCLPAGCLVPLAFDAQTTSALKAGAVLAVSVTPNEGAQEVTFPIPLTGFASALVRVADLVGQ